MGTNRRKPQPPVLQETLHDEIGFWSEIKLDILRRYWPEYTRIVKKQSIGFRTLYVDAFAGSGKHVSKERGDFVMGSPARALEVEPPFDEYHFIDMDKAKVRSLENLAAARSDVFVHHGDCNDILVNEVFPRAEYRDYRRAVCLLDPYSLQLDWTIVRRAGEMRSVEVFLNFPIMDINRNVLRPRASAEKERQMTRFWGDESWRDTAYRHEETLFGDTEVHKIENRELVAAFRERMKNVGGFEFVPEPIAMRNSKHATVYYLFFGGNNKTGAKIVDWIFADYRRKGYG
ncbi:MAG: three-Cys-motif partner protein TcmP [Acidobacteriota bacterium]